MSQYGTHKTVKRHIQDSRMALRRQSYGAYKTVIWRIHDSHYSHTNIPIATVVGYTMDWFECQIATPLYVNTAHSRQSNGTCKTVI